MTEIPMNKFVKTKMLVQITVAGVVILFILSGVLIPDDFYQRAADELLFEEGEENNNENVEAVTYWRKAVGSLDITLAISAGLGTLLTAILSYRFNYARWVSMGQWIQEFLRKEDRLGVKVIMQPSGSAFMSESKECLSDQFHEANDNCSTITTSDEASVADKKETSEEYETASSSSFNQKNPEVALKEEDIDEILNASEQALSCAPEKCKEPQEYQTLEARLVAVEGSLMRSFDSRMKIFEQQLEEFRTKMRSDSGKNFLAPERADSEPESELKPAFEDYDFSTLTKPSKCVLEDVAVTFKNALPSRRYSSLKTGLNAFTEHIHIGDMSSTGPSEIDSKDNMGSDIFKADSYSCRSSDCGSEIVSDAGSNIRKTRIPCTLVAPKKKFTTQPKTCVKVDTKSEQHVVRPGVPIKQQISSPATAKKSPERPISPSSAITKRHQRSRQQIRAIINHTNEKLTQRVNNKLRQANRV